MLEGGMSILGAEALISRPAGQRAYTPSGGIINVEAQRGLGMESKKRTTRRRKILDAIIWLRIYPIVLWLAGQAWVRFLYWVFSMLR